MMRPAKKASENVVQVPLLTDLSALFFPDVCLGCGDHMQQNEDVICMYCMYELPKTHFHTYRGNPVEKLFWGRVPIALATSFLFFRKEGLVQHLLHGLKYRGMKEAGTFLGRLMGAEVLKQPPFNTIDVIIPVPLHPRKIKQRGYNQCHPIVMGMEMSAGKTVLYNTLVRSEHTASQTRKGRYQRWENVKDVFEIHHPGALHNTHVLLVDDVITTGATMEACAATLLEIPGVRVSIATIACA